MANRSILSKVKGRGYSRAQLDAKSLHQTVGKKGKEIIWIGNQNLVSIRVEVSGRGRADLVLAIFGSHTDSHAQEGELEEMTVAKGQLDGHKGAAAQARGS